MRLFELAPEFWSAAAETLYMVALTMLFGGAPGSCSARGST